MILTRKFFVRIKLIFALLVMLLSPFVSFSQPVSAIATYDKTFFAKNDIIIYNPTDVCTPGAGGAGGALTGEAPTSLTGSSNQEKVWNYFIARGLTPIAAAGAMGNIAQESNFSASAKEAKDDGGLGIIQWTGTRRTKLEETATKTNINLEDNDAALLFELNYLWDGEYDAMTWQTQLNAETTVEGNTSIASYNSKFSKEKASTQAGNGSTMVFHSLVERSNDVPTDADKYDGVGVLTNRIDKAKGFLEQFNGDNADGGGSCNVGAGGLTFEQASVLGKKIVDNWSSIYCNTPLKGRNLPDGYCNWDSGYCTAGAAWLATTTSPTGKDSAIPNGVKVANSLIASNPDVYTNANPDGSNLLPFSVWSFGEGSSSGDPGHTGTIVGVGADGSIITLETNWGGVTSTSTQSYLYNPGHKVAVFQYPSFDAFKASHNGYVYNATATPKDTSIADGMAQKISAFMEN